jgi:hypothetical protein
LAISNDFTLVEMTQEDLCVDVEPPLFAGITLAESDLHPSRKQSSRGLTPLKLMAPLIEALHLTYHMSFSLRSITEMSPCSTTSNYRWIQMAKADACWFGCAW